MVFFSRQRWELTLLFVAAVLVVCASNAVAQGTPGSSTFTDPRDGKKYKAVVIGGKKWMAENLNYQPLTGKSWCYSDDNSNCGEYGRLYDWNTAKVACPGGWHLPTDLEWDNLVEAVGGNRMSGKKLKARSGWNSSGNEADSYGFSARPGGFRSTNGIFYGGGGASGVWWMATESSDGSAYFRYMDSDKDNIREDIDEKGSGFSVRCVFDDLGISPSQSEATDIDYNLSGGGSLKSDGDGRDNQMDVLSTVSGQINGTSDTSADTIGKGGFATDNDAIISGVGDLKSGGDGGIDRKGVTGIGYGSVYGSGISDGAAIRADDWFGGLDGGSNKGKASPPASPKYAAAQERQNVAVYMVGEEPAGARGAYKVLGGELAKAISGSKKFSAIDRTEAILDQLSKEHIYQRSGAVSDDQIKALGRQFGAQYLCIVEISDLQGGSFYVDMRLVDVITAEIAVTATANSNLKGSAEMIRVAQQITRELVDAEGVKKEMKRKNVKKKAFLVTGVTLDVLGAGAVAYGLYENYNASNFIKDKNFTTAEDAVLKRNLAYVAGCALLLSGISIHIFF